MKKKKSIARLISTRIFALIFISVAMLFVASYFTISDIIKTNTQRYSQSITSVYSDLAAYNSSKDNSPIGEKDFEEIKLYGDYFCKYYDIDYAAIFKPDTKNGTITIVNQSYNERIISQNRPIFKAGEVFDYKFSKEDLAVLNGEKMFSFSKYPTDYGTEFVTFTLTRDDFGNKFLTAVAFPYNKMWKESILAFSFIGLSILIVLVGLYFLSQRIIRRRVSDPAKRIAGVMSNFAKDGQLSDISLQSEDCIEFSMIADAFNKMSSDVTTYMQNEAELGVAAKIQQGILPKQNISGNDCYIQCVMQPAKNVGGDFYDYIELDEDRTMVVIADVSGKGVTAAIFMAITLVLIRENAKRDLSPGQIFEMVNNIITDRNPAMLFATAFIGIYDRRDSSFTYSNAGHNLPYVIGDELKQLDQAKGVVLGLFPGETYDEAKITLHKGDTFYAYTDGVSEVINDSQEFYGIERLENKLRSYIGGTAQNLVPEIYNSIREFSGDAEQFDDITMISLTVKDTKIISLNYDIKEFSKIRDMILKLPLEHSELMQLCLAAEEIFVNICDYAFPAGAPADEKIEFALSQSDVITLRFTDGGAKFNPAENVEDQSEYDPDNQYGGLGVFLTAKVVDTIRYEYENEKNVTSLIKKCEETK